MSMNTISDKSAILWTGGKDCALALHEARDAGYTIDRLVTFAPANPSFLAHPIAVMQAQARAMGLGHEIVEVGSDARADYRAAIARLREQDGIGTLVTGDIDLVAGLPNFVKECCEGLDVQTCMPLWNRDRLDLMTRLIDLNFAVVLSLVKKPWFTSDWLGRRIDAACLRDLRDLHTKNGVDLCGENGEYHTIVLNGPGFAREITLELDGQGSCEEMMYLKVRGVQAG